MKAITITLFAAISFLSACTAGKKATTPAASLYETKWSLKKIYASGSTEEVNTKAFIRFDAAKGSAGGNGSCNSFGSNAAISGNEVKFTNVFSTKMYCEGVQQVENKFLGGLEKVTRYEIEGSILKLYAGDALSLEFAAE